MSLRAQLQRLVWLVLVLCLQPHTVFAWGNEAHRVTALMAQEMLTPRARSAATELLDGGNLADASGYMDVYREALKREIPGSEAWHFDNRPICNKSAASDKPATGAPEYCQGGNCLSAQVPRLFGILANHSRERGERQQALRFLVHMVGDMHQPLHASDDNDAGGNRKLVLMPGGKIPINLHLAWDV